MRTLQDRMNEMIPYFRGIEMYNDALMVKVVFPNNWKAYPSDDGTIKVTASDDGSMTYYYGDSKETTYDDIFDLVEQTIKANQDIVLKLKLLKEKVEELKELFQANSYDDLVNLKFVIENNTKSKRKTPKKAKVAKKVEECQNQDENITEEIKEEKSEE